MPAFTCVIDGVAGRQNLSRGSLQSLKSFFFRHARTNGALDFRAVALLKAIERARRGFCREIHKAAHAHESAVSGAHLHLQHALGVCSLVERDLRNDFVTAPVVIEPIDVAATQQHAEVLSHACKIKPKVGDFAAIKIDARLRQVDLQIGIDICKLAACPASTNQHASVFLHLSDIFSAGNDEFDIKLARARQRRRTKRKRSHFLNAHHVSKRFTLNRFGRAFAIMPVASLNAAESAINLGDLEEELGFLDAHHALGNFVEAAERVVERGIRSADDDVEHDAFVFGRREFLSRHLIERHRSRGDEHARECDDPTDSEHLTEQFVVHATQTFEASVDFPREPAFFATGGRDPCTHDGTERDGDDA